MASIKVKFRPSTVADHEGTIYFQIIHNRVSRQLNSNLHLFSSEWDADRSIVRPSKDPERLPYLISVREGIRRESDRISRIIMRFEREGLFYSTDDIIGNYHRFTTEYTLFNFMETLIVKLKKNGRIRTSETYSSALRSFRMFRKERDIVLDCLDREIVEDYEAWLLDKGITPNTVSFYNRILRAVYNRAVDQEIIPDCRPFRHVYTGVDKTVKRALPLNMLRKIKKLDLSFSSRLMYARDMFLLSFMLRGMSFVDMAYLRKSDRENGYVTYRRKKTGQYLIIEWTREMQAILDTYPENQTQYLLPIICTSEQDDRAAYKKSWMRINRDLKVIARMVKLTVPLTLYVARHSWASVAKAKGIPIQVISEGMGHDSETTTRIYLASLDTDVVDRANSIIIKSI